MTLSGMSILLAEDNPTNQMVAVQMLETLGATVTLAVDGAEALEFLEEKPYDAALIDIEMPRISGIDLINQLRERGGRFSDLPMIALTAYVMRDHRLAIEEAGADGIIAKPILSIEQFGDDILGLVRQRRAASGVSDAERLCGTVSGSADVDPQVFESLCAAFDDKARQELMGKIESDIGSARDRIEAGLGDDNFDEIRASTHVLISVAGAIGATKLQNLAQCLNSAGHAADTAAIGRDGPELLAEADRVLGFVRSN